MDKTRAKIYNNVTNNNDEVLMNNFNNTPNDVIFTSSSQVKNVFYLYGVIDNTTITPTILNTIRNLSPDCLFELRINSPGGWVDYGMPMIHTLQNDLAGKALGVIDGVAYSMAALIFKACSVRAVYPTSNMLLHTVSSSLEGKVPDVLDHAINSLDGAKYLMKSLFRGNFKEEELNNILAGREYYLSAFDMLNRGIADYIIIDGEFVKRKQYLKGLKKSKKGN
jgi:ATP-dependent protease ClpP protease subunit